MWFVTLTCSEVLFSAVLGRFEESGLSDVSDREDGLLEGVGESDWCRSEWPGTAAQKTEGWREESRRVKARTRHPESRSINNAVDEGLWNAFLKCDITAFNGNWAEKVLLSNSCLSIEKHSVLLVFSCCCKGAVSFNASLSRYHTTP